MICKRAIIGANGTDLCFLCTTPGPLEIELMKEKDGGLWITDAAGFLVPYISTKTDRLETGKRMGLTTKHNGEVRGVYQLTTDGFHVLKNEDGRILYVRDKEVSVMETDGRPESYVASLTNPGVVNVSYTTSSLRSSFETLARIKADGSVQMQTILRISNASRKSYSVEKALVTPRNIGNVTEARGYVQACSGASAGSPTVTDYTAALFGASFSRLNLEPFSTIHRPLDPWKFACQKINVVEVCYQRTQKELGSWKTSVTLYDPEVSLLVQSNDDRLFPGGSVSLRTDSQAAQVHTAELANGEYMLLKVSPNHRISAKLAQKERSEDDRTELLEIDVSAPANSRVAFVLPKPAKETTILQLCVLSNRRIVYEATGSLSRVQFVMEV